MRAPLGGQLLLIRVLYTSAPILLGVKFSGQGADRGHAMPEEETGQYGTFLRAMPAAHTYLGDVRDLPGNSDIRYELSRLGGPVRCNLPLLPVPYQVPVSYTHLTLPTILRV